MQCTFSGPGFFLWNFNGHLFFFNSSFSNFGHFKRAMIRSKLQESGDNCVKRTLARATQEQTQAWRSFKLSLKSWGKKKVNGPDSPPHSVHLRILFLRLFDVPELLANQVGFVRELRETSCNNNLKTDANLRKELELRPPNSNPPTPSTGTRQKTEELKQSKLSPKFTTENKHQDRWVWEGMNRHIRWQIRFSVNYTYLRWGRKRYILRSELFSFAVTWNSSLLHTHSP